MDALQRLLPTRHRQLVHALSFRALLVVPVILAVATAIVLFLYSDVNVVMLFSQCHSRARLPALSRVPGIGTLLCALVSFFGEALASVRSFAVMSVVLSFLSGLLTMSIVEAARICNGPNVLIAYPTGPWLVFNMLGGAFIWEILIIPAFARRSKQLWVAADADAAVVETEPEPEPEAADLAGSTSSNHATAHPATDANTGASSRHLALESEVAAIPIAVALGYILPSLFMLVYRSPAAIFVWLFFPVYVSLVRQAVRLAASYIVSSQRTIHLESHRLSLLAVYAVPIVCSALSYGMLVWSLTQADDKREMTRSTLRFIEIDTIFIGLTVLYWMLVEAGWRVVLVAIAFGLVFGPGAGLCAGWIHRESQLGFAVERPPGLEEGAYHDESQPSAAGEETPLLQ